MRRKRVEGAIVTKWDGRLGFGYRGMLRLVTAGGAGVGTTCVSRMGGRGVRFRGAASVLCAPL